MGLGTPDEIEWNYSLDEILLWYRAYQEIRFSKMQDVALATRVGFGADKEQFSRFMGSNPASDKQSRAERVSGFLLEHLSAINDVRTRKGQQPTPRQAPRPAQGVNRGKR